VKRCGSRLAITEATTDASWQTFSHECIGTRTTKDIHRVRNYVKEVNDHGR